MTAHRLGIDFRYELLEGDDVQVRSVTEATGFFRADEVGVAEELARDRLEKGKASDYQFVLAEREGRLVGYACYGPIACTIGSFDLYWIVVGPESQGSGIGRQLLQEAERLISLAAGRRVYVETSGREQYGSTRAFYERCGYEAVARLEDFYDRGDDKMIYVKALR